MANKNTYEFLIHFGVNGGQQFDEVDAYTGAMAQTVMESRYPNAELVTIRNVTYNTDDKVSNI